MTTKKVEIVISPNPAHFVGDGFRVHNFIPSVPRLDMKRMDPFIMLDYNSKFHFNGSETPRGVGVHPHRGFETVTIAYEGKVEHHDSAGGGGIIGEGDIQWMTAASGILHKEYHEENFSKQGGLFQMVQLWINLPAKDKMSSPKYQGVKRNELQKFELPNNTGLIEVIAGNYENVKGSVSTFTPIEMYNARLNNGAKVDFSFPENYNTGFVIIEGSVKVNGKESAKTDQFIHFKNEGENIEIVALENSVILILGGEPINEPIVSYGPFLMNTQQEIKEALADYNEGKFGYLE